MTSGYPLTAAWEPTPAHLPIRWLEFVKTLEQQVSNPSHTYVLKMRYDAQRVGNLLHLWGLPWQVVMAAYLWDYHDEVSRAAQLASLPEVERVLSHSNEATNYVHYIEDEKLLPLLSPPYRDTGALLMAVAICFQALQDLQRKSNGQSYTGELSGQIESIGHTLHNIATALGMWLFKYDIEDLREQLQSPQRFAEASRERARILEQDSEKLEWVRQFLMSTYQEMTGQPVAVRCIPCGVTAMKRRQQEAHTTTTARKMQLTGFDLVNFAVIVPTVRACYEAFGVLSLCGHIQDRIIDLIADPKPNGCSHLGVGLTLTPDHPYTQGLTWLPTQGQTCQLHISTALMYGINWYGCLHPTYYQLCTRPCDTLNIEKGAKNESVSMTSEQNFYLNHATHKEATSEPASSERTEARSEVDHDTDVSGATLWQGEDGKAFRAIQQRLTSKHNPLDAQNPIIVYDRKRSAVALSKGATALDFAYKVDKEMGEHAIEAFINNRKMPLYRTLDANDIVEIKTSHESQVQDYWLQQDYAVTPLARSYIQQSLDCRHRDRRGYHLLLQALERYHYQLTPEEMDEEIYHLVRRHGLGTPQTYLAQLAEKREKRYTPGWAARTIIEQREEQQVRSAMDKEQVNWIPVLDLPTTMTEKLSYKSLICDFCHPTYPGDAKIMGQWLESGDGLIVHRESCPQLISHDGSLHLLPMSWQQHSPTFHLTFTLVAIDRKGLVRDVATRLYEHTCTVSAIQARAVRDKAELQITIGTNTDMEALNVWQDLETVDGVITVYIDISNTSSSTSTRLQKLHNKSKQSPRAMLEIEQFLHDLLPGPPPRSPILKNPFDISRPACARMFFGRTQETKIMQRELCEGERGKALILYGPRRSGKSSICRNFLDRQVTPPLWGVHFSLQNSIQKSEESILANLSKEIATQFRLQLGQPGIAWEASQEPDALIRFRLLLQDYFTRSPQIRLVLVLDEFGAALESYKKQALSDRFFMYWKELMDDVPQLSLIMALPTSSHTLLTRTFSHAFSFAETIPLAFLDAQSATQLLVDPLQDQHILIHPQAVTLAIKLTGGNPYYMTLIGQRLIRHLNREKEKQKVTEGDLHPVVNQLIDEGSHQNFGFLRYELQHPEEFRILEALVELSQSDTPQLKKLARWLNLPVHQVRQHLDRLRVGLVLEENGPPANPSYSFRIDLVRRWLARNRWFFTESPV